MARWILGDADDSDLVIEATDDQVSLYLPSRNPAIFSADRVEHLRTLLGAAVGVARGRHE